MTDVASFRPSSYIAFGDAPDGNTTVLFHGYQGFIDRVDRRVASFLRSTPFLLENARMWSVSAAQLLELVRRGFLTSLSAEEEVKRFVELSKRIHKRSVSANRPSFTFIPTYSCNLRCHYCYQSHDLHQDSTIMDPACVDAAFHAISVYIEQVGLRDPNFIKIYGGEPLLKECRTAVSAITENSLRRGWPIEVITNGTELEYFLDLVGVTGIAKLQVTVDGPKRIHDTRRRAAEWPHTFDKIMSNIDAALERGAHVQLRVNVDKTNVDTVPELYDEVSTRGWLSRDTFSFYPTPVTPARHIDERLALINSQSMFKILQESSRSSPMQVYSAVDRAAKQVRESGRAVLTQTSYCGANTGSLIFDPYGYIYSCDNDIGDSSRSIGRLENGSVEIDSEAHRFWLDRNIANIAQCSKCAVALLCGGGCAYNASVTNGSHYKSYCDGFRAHVASRLPQAYNEFLHIPPDPAGPVTIFPADREIPLVAH